MLPRSERPSYIRRKYALLPNSLIGAKSGTSVAIVAMAAMVLALSFRPCSASAVLSGGQYRRTFATLQPSSAEICSGVKPGAAFLAGFLAAASAAFVAGPATPSAASPWSAWNCVRARFVAGPKTPSAPPVS